MKIVILTEIPAPFRIPLFNALADRPGVELTVVFLRAAHPARPYQLYPDELRFHWAVLPGFHIVRGSRWLIVNVGVGRAIRRARADVVVLGGWNQPAFWTGLLRARSARRPAVAWVESTSRDARSGLGPLESAKRRFLRACAGFLVPGQATADYLADLGIAGGRVVIAPNAVDGRIFGERVLEARAGRDELRAQLGLSGFVVLSVGRLDPEKGIDVLIEAIGRLPATASLVIAGTGREEERLRTLADRVAPGRVRLLGFVGRDELVPWYAAADVFALPSRSEQWGMTLNEATLAGLPVVATDVAGAARELVEDGVSGFRVQAGDVEALSAALERLRADEAFRHAAGLRSAELATRLTPEAWTAAVEELARSVVL